MTTADSIVTFSMIALIASLNLGLGYAAFHWRRKRLQASTADE